ncbi:MAG: recombination-associated protein RdgC [Desulfuromonadales bacterium]|nr:recombination-associated protein RdgC [Desulfuromonadales bacterium]
MGIMNNTVSICQFEVIGTMPPGDLVEWAGACLARNAFRSIEQTSEELSIGWVQLDDLQESSFDGIQTYQRDQYLVFSFRRDQRKLPATLFKAYMDQAEAEFLAENPNLHRVPKPKRENLRDALRGALFARALPTPMVHDVVWNTHNNLVTFTNLSAKTIELFVDLFNKSFEGLRLVPICPFARALRLADEPLAAQLQEANLATSDAVLDLIDANQWIGRDFLLWLLYETMNASAEYMVCQPGPAAEGECFVAYLNDRLVLAGTSENGVQKVSVTGPQDHFNEVCTALQGGKDIHEAVIYLEKQELLWKLTLKGETFHFASFKAPPVKIEKDDLADPAHEQEAVFYERMYTLNEGQQLFDSLYTTFLRERLGGNWAGKQRAIHSWLAAD